MTLRLCTEPRGPLVLGLGPEEAIILFAPRGMFRGLAADAPWREGLRFLATGGAAPRLRALLPRAAVRALLRGAAGHAVEAELKRRLFDLAEPADWPEF